MERDRWEQIERLYHATLEHAPSERAAFLDKACAGDADLRHEVAGLLDADDPDDSFIQSPAIEIAARALAAELPPEIQTGAQPDPPAPPLPAMKFDRLTNNGKAGDAAISPDGKYVAYTEREEGKQSIWIRQTTSASAVQIVPPAAIWYYWLSFSRDGNDIYYLADDAADGNSVRKAFYQIPVSRSATPRKLLANIWSSVTLSPDGKRLAFVRWQFNQSERTLMLANVDGSGEQKLATSNSPACS